MTREEAIDRLKEARVGHYEFLSMETLNMAIKALEQEPKYCDRNICTKNEYNNIGCDECEVTKSQEPCEDAISRQAALDCFTATKLKKFDFILYAREEIKRLPSVTPQQRIGHWIWQTEDIYRCSECGEDIRVKEVMNIPQYKVCPMCEARMYARIIPVH